MQLKPGFVNGHERFKSILGNEMSFEMYGHFLFKFSFEVDKRIACDSV